MRIVIFTDAYPPFINGVSTSVFNLVNVLRKNGHQVLPVGPKFGNGKSDISENGIFLNGIELKGFYGYKFTSLYSNKVFKIIKNFKPDLIHIQTDFSIGWFGRIVAKLLKDVAVLYTYHTSYEDYTYYFSKNSGLKDRFAKRFVKAYNKILAKEVTEYITPSQKTMDYMRSNGIDSYINIVPTGIDFSSFADDKINQNEIEKFKKDHHIAPKTKVFLVLGRMAEEKSVDVSIKAFHAFRQKYPNIPAKMLVVGDGPSRAELQNLVFELKETANIEFLGKVMAEEVSFYYHLADVYTSASVTETQGLTFMESMASGTIVLARFDSQLSDTIIDGETGFYFHDIPSFVDKAKLILDLSEEEKERIKGKAYEFLDQYSIEKFYDNMIRVYNRAVRKKW